MCSSSLRVSQKQLRPLYIRNDNLPAADMVVTYRTAILCGVMGIVPLLLTNIEFRPKSWSWVSLFGACLFGLANYLHAETTIRSFGDASRVPVELIIIGSMMIFNTFCIVAVLARLVALPQSTQYFTYRQHQYLLAMRELFVSQHHNGHRPGTRGSGRLGTGASGRLSSAGGKVHPLSSKSSEGDSGPLSDRSSDSGRSTAKLLKQKSKRSVARGKLRALSDSDRAATASSILAGIGLKEDGKERAGGILGSAFQYPVRFLQGFGLSFVMVLIAVVVINSTVNASVFFLGRLRAEVVNYRERIGNHRTSFDAESDDPGVPVPPYSRTYDLVALSYTVVESFYETEGERGLFDSLISSMTAASIIGTAAVAASYIWAWRQQFRSYREGMIKIRDNPALIDAFKYPVVEAGGYVGRQMWSSVISALMVYTPIAFAATFIIWPATQTLILLYCVVPILVLVFLESISFSVRRTFNRLSTQGPYINSRHWFGAHDFMGIFIHMITGAALACTRLLYTYIDFAISIGRLDRPVLQGKIRHWDAGHTTFTAMMYLDYIYNAPVTSLLAHNLAKVMEARDKKRWDELANLSVEAEAGRKKERTERENRHRWQLLFTLRCNPEIKKHRLQPPPPGHAWDNDEIREYEHELRERKAEWEHHQRILRARAAGKDVGAGSKYAVRPGHAPPKDDLSEDEMALQ